MSSFLIMLTCFLNDTSPTEIYTLSLHDALPISGSELASRHLQTRRPCPAWSLAFQENRRAFPSGREQAGRRAARNHKDRKSTRLNSSHTVISYAVFCLKKKIVTENETTHTIPSV